MKLLSNRFPAKCYGGRRKPVYELMPDILTVN